jgi:glycerophosphoryl diester phosphodiesterase
MPTRLPALLQPPIGFAHRGAKAHADENTLAAFDLARRLGATGLESDAWLTRDGQVVLDHDGVVGRWPNRRSIRSVDRAALPHHVPTLDELFAQVGPGVPLSLDLKDPDTFGEVVAVARRHDAHGSLWLCHPDLAVLRRWRDEDATVRLVHSTRKKACSDGLERHVARLAEHAIDALNMPAGDWTGGNVALAHRFDRYAFAWDAQLERVLVSLLDMGVDGVFSDWSDRLADAFARLGLGPAPSP